MWSESEGYIKIPLGLYERIESKCEDAGIIVDNNDKRSHGRPIRVRFKGELRDQQTLASQQLE